MTYGYQDKQPYKGIIRKWLEKPTSLWLFGTLKGLYALLRMKGVILHYNEDVPPLCEVNSEKRLVRCRVSSLQLWYIGVSHLLAFFF